MLLAEEKDGDPKGCRPIFFAGGSAALKTDSYIVTRSTRYLHGGASQQSILIRPVSYLLPFFPVRMS